MQETYKRFRQPPQSDRERSQAVFRNFFLHIHSTRIHKFSLKPTYTFGLGLMAFFLFIILSVTGILLMIYYNPAIDQAYNSVKDISFVVGAGKYMRNIHRWSAHGMVFVVLLHMVRVFYTGSYKGGRGFNWQIGTGLLVVTFMLSFSGYLLPWDQLAYWAVTIGSNIAASPRELTDALGMTQYLDIGGLSKQIMIGGNTVGQDALTRFYLLHVIILPVVCTIMIGLHFWRIRKDGGLSRPENADQLVMEAEGSTAEEAEGKKGEFKLNPNKTYGLMELVKGRSAHLDRGPDQTVMTWPVGIWAEVAVFMLTLSVMLLLAYFFDAPLKELANPAIPENPAKAPWYFLGLQELVSYSAFMGGVGIPTLVVGFMLMLPYLDREPNHVGLWFSNGEGKRVARNSMLLTAAFLTSLLAFTVKFGWLRNWFPKISQTIIIFINPGTILVGFFSIWTLWILKKTGSTRTAALALFSCFLVSFIILTIMGSHFRGPNWDFFWSHADWPVH
ncbi:MAG: DUF4405 domain-containing protein [bacterium]|nr:DUF4405 domain-containing protein [bacterium]